ncbi:MAG: hypothetical protein GOVbin7368_46 [Prokaryotic dsDNA virus sp.]|nr:MAG: hypothetical protein GOVbin7368_46 [Prokaryotic dsDNA virus sp.]|tara:strand:+ start:14597 stop:14767 length:171 start_codon:yes stop_codon:yes gene_type:complete
MTTIFAFSLFALLVYGLLKTAVAAGDRAKEGAWGRLTIAGLALAAPVIFALVYGVN